MARDAVCRAVLHHIERAGVTLAYPKLDMYHAEMPVTATLNASRWSRMNWAPAPVWSKTIVRSSAGFKRRPAFRLL